MFLLFIIILIVLIYLYKSGRFKHHKAPVFEDYYDTTKWKGDEGEIRVHNVLTELPEDYFILDNIILPTTKGTTQIDHIVVSKYGVFAIETKNFRGHIYGNDNSTEWKQIIKTNVQYRLFGKIYTHITKNTFYNPVKQAVGHAKVIKKALKDYPHLPVVPIVVFAGEATIEVVTSKIHVIYLDQLLDTIQSYQSIYLREENIAKVACLLSNMNISEFVSEEEHISNIYRNIDEYNYKIDNDICPRCGGTLIIKSGLNGQFYGCSNYPKCKFTYRIG